MTGVKNTDGSGISAGQLPTSGSVKYVPPPVYTVEGPKLVGYEAENRAVTNGESKSDQAGKSKVEGILAERGKRYGNYFTHSAISQELKAGMVGTNGWHNLADDQKETLEMIAHKIGRILNGDPDYVDNWDDIAGYATLVSKRLTGNGI